MKIRGKGAIAFAAALGCVLWFATAAGAATLKADYGFADTLASSVAGAPGLSQVGTCANAGSYATETVNGAQKRVLTFDQGCGLELDTTNLIPADGYSVVMLLRVSSTDQFRRLFDANPSGDYGMYVTNGNLNYYVGGFDGFMGSGEPIQPDKYVQVVLTRDGATKQTIGYVNGTEQFNFTDDSDRGLIGANKVRFLIDDGSEASAGAAARIRAYDAPLTAEEVAALDGNPPSDVSITKTDDADPGYAGQPLSYTLAVSDSGPPASGVLVTDQLPAGVTFVSASPGCAFAAGKVTCDVDTVSPGPPTELKVVVRPSVTNPALSNTATVTSTSLDADPTNNSSTATTEVRLPADVSVNMTDTADPSYVGGTITYSLSVANAGPGTASSVVATDELSADTELVSASPGCVESKGVVTCDFGSMPMGATAARQIVVRPTAPDPILLNTVRLRSAGDFNAANDAVTVFTDVRDKSPSAAGDAGGGAKENPAPAPAVKKKAIRCKVPNVRGKTLRAARRALKTAHCKAGKLRKVRSRSMRRGRVVKTRPKAGAVRSDGASVRLYVSRGAR